MSLLEAELERLRRSIVQAHHETDPLDIAAQRGLEMIALDLGALIGEGATDFFSLQSVLRQLTRLNPHRYPWALHFSRSISAHFKGNILQEDVSLLHRLEVGRRLISAHRFFEGSGGIADFQAVGTTSKMDIVVGLGLGLRNGQLPRLLKRLSHERGGGDPERALRPFFDRDSGAMAEAVSSSGEAISDYLQSRMILRHDPRSRRLIGELPDEWQARFHRIGSDIGARQIQLELMVGQRLMEAKKTAKEHGLKSIRGLALAFELQPIIRREFLPSARSHTSESDRMLGLAERVLQRVRGGLYQHWSARMKTLIAGEGSFEGRRYHEDQWLGSAAMDQPWKHEPNMGLGHTEELSIPSPTSLPVQGRDYIVQSGDHLSQIARRAYQGAAGYRYLLESNPQLRSPSELIAGQRLRIPSWPPVSVGSQEEGVVLEIDGETLCFHHRRLGPLPRSRERLEEIARNLAQIPLQSLLEARAEQSSDRTLVRLKQRTLLQLGARDLALAKAHFSDSNDLLFRWAKLLAAQLRGDLILPSEHYLPLGYHQESEHRHHWLRGRITRAFAKDRLYDLTLLIDEEQHCVEIKDQYGDRLVQLHSSDIEAIKKRPGRRLSDQPLFGRAFLQEAACLWLSDLRKEGVELLVSPLQDPRRYPSFLDQNTLLYLPPIGTPVFPMARGVICQADSTKEHGGVVWIEHPHGIFSRYGNLGAITVQVGQEVLADQILGRVGMDWERGEPSLSCNLQKRSSREENKGAGWIEGDPSVHITVLDPLLCLGRPTRACLGVKVLKDG